MDVARAALGIMARAIGQAGPRSMRPEAPVVVATVVLCSDRLVGCGIVLVSTEVLGDAAESGVEDNPFDLIRPGRIPRGHQHVPVAPTQGHGNAHLVGALRFLAIEIFDSGRNTIHQHMSILERGESVDRRFQILLFAGVIVQDGRNHGLLAVADGVAGGIDDFPLLTARKVRLLCHIK